MLNLLFQRDQQTLVHSFKIKKIQISVSVKKSLAPDTTVDIVNFQNFVNQSTKNI